MDFTPDMQHIGARYRLERVIGTGGMGTVYHALDRLTGRAVALKRVKTKLDDLEFSSKSRDENETALVKEFRTLSTLRHPYIIDVLDYGFDAERNPFFTMELLDGGQSVREYAIFATPEEILARVIEMLQVLVYLHRRGILHRDIKPSNLMVINNHIKILDFGLAKTVEARSSEYTKDNIAGTVAYMAPELFKGGAVSKATDLYAIGLLAFELLAGEYPFKGRNLAHLAYEIMNTEPDWMRLNMVSDAVLDVIDRLLLKDPKVRYNDASEALADLRNALNYPPDDEAFEIRESFLQAASFIGRDEEMKMLRKALDDVSEGQGSAWLIGGESGVGKTRLLDELRIRVMVKGVLMLRGQATAERRDVYHMWRSVARNICLEVELTDLEAQVLKQLVPDISQLIGRDVADAVSVQPQVAIERLAHALETAIRKLNRPVVLVLDDLHWTRESLDILKNILKLIHEIPLLIIGSFRNDTRPDLPDEVPEMTYLSLSRLKASEIRALSASMLGHSGEDNGLVEMLERETEGNALFIIEVVRALAEEAGELENIGRITLPYKVFAKGIRTVIQRRIQRVPKHALLPLQLAAIAGRQIDMQVLQNAMPDYNWRFWLIQCSNNAIITVDQYQWQFAHDKIREGILDDISPETKRDYSERIATVIEELYGEDSAYAAILTNHWHNAENSEKELEYAYITAEHLHTGGNFQAMRRYLERALALTEAVPISDVKRWHMEVRLAEAHSQFSDLEQATDMLEKLLNTIPSQGKPEVICVKLEAYYHFAVAVTNIGEVERGRSAAYEALELVPYCSDDSKRTKIYWVLGLTETFSGNYKVGEKYYKKSLKLSKKINDLMFIMSSYIGLGGVSAFLEQFDNAIQYNEKAVELARKTGSFLYESYAVHNTGAFLIMMEKYEEALPYVDESIEMDKKLNILPSLSLSLINHAYCTLMMDRFDESMKSLIDGLDLAHELKAIPTALLAIGTYGVYKAKHGEDDVATDLIAFMLANPKTQIDDRVGFDKIRRQLGYDDSTMTAATERAKSLKLDTIIDDILRQETI